MAIIRNTSFAVGKTRDFPQNYFRNKQKSFRFFNQEPVQKDHPIRAASAEHMYLSWHQLSRADYIAKMYQPSAR